MADDFEVDSAGPPSRSGAARPGRARVPLSLAVGGLALCSIDLALRQVARRSLLAWLGVTGHDPSPSVVAVTALLIGLAASAALLWTARRHTLRSGWLADRIVVLALGVLFAIGLVAQLRLGARLQSDGFYYFAYLRSIAFDHDVDFTNDYRLLGLESHTHLFGPTPTGYAHSAWTIGPALVWSPFFAAGHQVAKGLRAWGVDVQLDGTSFPYRQAVAVGGLFYGLLGTWFCYQLAGLFFPRGLAAAAAGVTIAGSFMLWYMVSEPTMTHAPSMAAVALFVLVWARTRGSTAWTRWAGLGALAGLMTLVRWQNALFALLPASEAVVALWRARTDRQWRNRWRIVAAGLAFVAAAAAGFSPQMFAWKAIYGQYLAVSPLGPEIRWWQPHLVDVLWSSRNGLLSMSPVLYLGLLGLVVFAGREPAFALPAIGTFLAMTWLNGSIEDWWGSAGFGMRRFDGVLPLLTVGLAMFVRVLSAGVRRWPSAVPAALLGFLIVWNVSFADAARSGAVRLGESLSFGELGAQQVRAIHRWAGYPFSYPVNLLYAVRHAVSPARYDLLGPGRFLSDPRRPYGRVDIGTGDEAYVLDGWYAPERDGGTSFRWVGKDAECLVPLDHATRLDLQIRLRPFSAPNAPAQSVRIVVNGTSFGPFALEPDWHDLRVETGADVWRAGVNRVRLEAAVTSRPADLGLSGDTRPLGLSVDFIRLSVPGST